MTVRELIAALEAVARPDDNVLIDIDYGGMKFSLEPTYVNGEDYVVEIGTAD